MCFQRFFKDVRSTLPPLPGARTRARCRPGTALTSGNFSSISFSGFTRENIFRGIQPAPENFPGTGPSGSLFTPSGTSRSGFLVLLPTRGARTHAGGLPGVALTPENFSFIPFCGFTREKVFRGGQPASENFPGIGPSGPPCPSVFSWAPVRTCAPSG